MLAGSVLASAMEGDDGGAKGYAAVGFFLANLKQLALRELSADPDSLREAKKLALDVKRLGNMPMEEEQRISKLAAAWMIGPDVTPVSLLSEVVRSCAGQLLQEPPKDLL